MPSYQELYEETKTELEEEKKKVAKLEKELLELRSSQTEASGGYAGGSSEAAPDASNLLGYPKDDDSEKMLNELLVALLSYPRNVFQMFKDNNQMIKLDMNPKVIDMKHNAEACKVLEALSLFPNILELDLTGDKLDDSGHVDHLLKAISNMTSLRKLRLAATCVDARKLVDVLPASLITLDLSANEMNEEQAQVLIEALPLMKNLKTLKLGRNKIGHEGAQALGKVLAQMQGLEELRIDQEFYPDIQDDVPKDCKVYCSGVLWRASRSKPGSRSSTKSSTVSGA